MSNESKNFKSVPVLEKMSANKLMVPAVAIILSGLINACGDPAASKYAGALPGAIGPICINSFGFKLSEGNKNIESEAYINPNGVAIEKNRLNSKGEIVKKELYSNDGTVVEIPYSNGRPGNQTERGATSFEIDNFRDGINITSITPNAIKLTLEENNGNVRAATKTITDQTMRYNNLDQKIAHKMAYRAVKNYLEEESKGANGNSFCEN